MVLVGLSVTLGQSSTDKKGGFKAVAVDSLRAPLSSDPTALGYS